MNLNDYLFNPNHQKQYLIYEMNEGVCVLHTIQPSYEIGFSPPSSFHMEWTWIHSSLHHVGKVCRSPISHMMRQSCSESRSNGQGSGGRPWLSETLVFIWIEILAFEACVRCVWFQRYAPVGIPPSGKLLQTTAPSFLHFFLPLFITSITEFSIHAGGYSARLVTRSYGIRFLYSGNNSVTARRM